MSSPARYLSAAARNLCFIRALFRFPFHFFIFGTDLNTGRIEILKDTAAMFPNEKMAINPRPIAVDISVGEVVED